MIDVRIYSTEDGKQPYVRWLHSLKERNFQLRILQRVERLSLGNFGDSKSVGAGVYELRFFFGKGYRIYYAKDGEAVVLLLSGGDKSNQQRDIERAKAYWKDYKRRIK